MPGNGISFEQGMTAAQRVGVLEGRMLQYNRDNRRCAPNSILSSVPPLGPRLYRWV